MPDAKAGIYAAPLTPFREDLSVDLPRWLAHCRGLLDAGCHGLMPLGSTGEGHSLTVDERIAAMDALAEAGLPMDRMLVGALTLNWPDAVRMAKHATRLGAGGVCVQPPFYYKPATNDAQTDRALADFFIRVIDDVNEADFRLYVYDNQNVLGIHLSLDMFAMLFEARPEHATGIKDTSADPDMLRARAAAFPNTVMSGTDPMTLTALRAGGTGTMSGIANIMPAATLALYADHDGAAGDDGQARLDAAVKLLRQYGWFPSLKVAMAWLSGDAAWRRVRPALRPLQAAEARAVIEGLGRLGLAPVRAAAE